MKWVHILVEGPTEETFVRDVLAPHLQTFDIYPSAKLLTTNRTRGGPHAKGGMTTYHRVKRDVLHLLGDTSIAMVTTLLDFYGVAGDFPGQNDMPAGTCYTRVEHLEKSFARDINHARFLAYLALHEFEGMLFANPDKIVEAFSLSSEGAAREARENLRKIREAFNSPEEINDGTLTAPSKRLVQIFTEYEKPFHGPLIASAIGLRQIRAECRHFDNWLRGIESLGEQPSA